MDAVWLEIFGYIGTALVVLSMMMTSLLWLRIFNMSGSVISATYSALVGAWPIVVLNVSLFAINLFHIIRERIKRSPRATCAEETVATNTATSEQARPTAAPSESQEKI